MTSKKFNHMHNSGEGHDSVFVGVRDSIVFVLVSIEYTGCPCAKCWNVCHFVCIVYILGDFFIYACSNYPDYIFTLHIRIMNDEYLWEFEKALIAKNVSLLPKYKPGVGSAIDIMFDILSIQDPEFLSKSIDLGWPIISHTDANPYEVYFKTFNIKSKPPDDLILEMMHTLKEKGANVSYLSNPANIPSYLVKIVSDFMEGKNYIKYNEYIKTPIRLISEKYTHMIPPISYDANHWKGTLCDSLGFFQHNGECWNDAAQMAILYTDGIKEITQPFLYSAKISEEYIKSIPEFKDASNTTIDIALVYINSLQRRFIRHYNLEVKRANTIANLYSGNILLKNFSCSQEILNEKHAIHEAIEQLKRNHKNDSSLEEQIESIKTKSNIVPRIRHNVLKTLETSGKSFREMNAMQGAVVGKVLSANNKYKQFNTLDKITYKYVPSINATLTEYMSMKGGFITTMFVILLTLCKIPNLSKEEYEDKKRGVYIVQRDLDHINIIENYIHDHTNAILFTSDRHAMLFYECGNKQYFYEDNSGPIPFMWKQFFMHETWSEILNGVPKEEYWNAEIKLYQASLSITYEIGTYNHYYYPVLKFGNMPDYYTLVPNTTKILKIISKNNTWISTNKDISVSNVERIYRTNYTFVNVSTHNERSNHIQSNAPWIPSAIRARPKTRRMNRKRKATRRCSK